MNLARTRRTIGGKLAAVGALLVGAVLCTALWRKAPLPAMALIQRPLAVSPNWRERLERWIPLKANFNWARHAVDMVFGQRRPIDFDAECFAFHDAYATRQLELEIGKPCCSLTHAGMTLWLLKQDDVKTLRVRLEHGPLRAAYRSRISTADGIRVTLQQGNPVILDGLTNRVGIQEDYFGRARSGCLDLLASLIVSQVVTNGPGHLRPNLPEVFVRTNVDLALRLQIPNDRAAFVLKRDPLNEGDKSFVFLLDPR